MNRNDFVQLRNHTGNRGFAQITSLNNDNDDTIDVVFLNGDEDGVRPTARVNISDIERWMTQQDWNGLHNFLNSIAPGTRMTETGRDLIAPTDEMRQAIFANGTNEFPWREIEN